MIYVPLDDRIVAVLNARAAAQGLSVAAYLERIALSQTHRTATPITPEELDRLLDQESAAGPSPTGTFSRTELYRDHD